MGENRTIAGPAQKDISPQSSAGAESAQAIPHANNAEFRSRKRHEPSSSRLSTPPFWRRTSSIQLVSIGLLFGVLLTLALNLVPAVSWDRRLFPVEAVALISAISYLVFRLVISQSNAQHDKTEALAERLETIEDLSWEIRESEERYRSLTEAFGDLVVHRDLEGVVLFANDAFVDSFGKEFRQTGQHFQLDDLVESEMDTEHGEQTAPNARDICLQTQVGQRWFSWLDLATRNEQTGSSAIISVARDITERKQHEATLEEARKNAESASRAKSRFVANVSHEIRTPLNGILGMADLLMQTSLSPSQQTYVKAVDTSGHVLLALVEDILDMAKVEAGHLELKPEPTNIRELLENLTELLAIPAYQKNIEVASFIDPKVATEILVDKGRLLQVLTNIAGNAVKFTENGGVLLKASLVSDDQQGKKQQIRIEVSDSGPGLTATDCERVFDAFEQADNGRGRKHNGAGLGLNISQHIVNKMGSRIELQSQVGTGSTFSFELDLKVTGLSSHRSRTENGKEGIVILMLQDSVEKLAISEYLTLAGYHIASCSNEDEAILLVDRIRQPENPISHIIIDQTDIDKTEKLVSELRVAADYPIKTISMVRPDERSSVQQLLNIGVDGWLMRPARARSIVEVLEGFKDSGEDEGSQNLAVIAKAPANNCRPLNILLVEDNEINQILASALMARSGHKVTVANNGQSAIDLFDLSLQSSHVQHFDLVLMDLHMPDMDGFETTGHIRAIESSAGVSAVPVLVLSADEQKGIRKKATESGCNGFIAKPIDITQLENAVNLVLETGI